MLELVGNPKDKFSHDAAHVVFSVANVQTTTCAYLQAYLSPICYSIRFKTYYGLSIFMQKKKRFQTLPRIKLQGS